MIKNTDVFNGDIGGGVFIGKSYPFVLQDGNNNLIIQFRNAIIDYFDKNKMFWRRGKPTNHTLSSQIACLNHLYPIREDKDAVLSIVKNIYPDIVDVLPIAIDKYVSAYIQFEAVSDDGHLNEGKPKGGIISTSIDALINGVIKTNEGSRSRSNGSIPNHMETKTWQVAKPEKPA